MIQRRHQLAGIPVPIGGALLEMMRGGDYKPTGKNLDGWYRGEFSFSYID